MYVSDNPNGCTQVKLFPALGRNVDAGSLSNKGEKEETGQLQLTVGRILSLAVVMVYAGVAMWAGGLGYWKWSLSLLLPLALIWFAEEIGSMTGYYKTGYVNVQTPGVFVAFMGWLLLLGVPVLLWLLRRAT